MSDKVRNHNRLSQVQYFKFAKWLEEHKDQLHAEKKPFAQAASWASGELGFPVTDDQVRRAAHGLDMLWEPASGSGGKNLWVQLRDRMIELEVEARTLKAELATCRAAVGWLADRCGEKLPTDLGIVQHAPPRVAGR